MVQRTVVTVVDDLDGESAADETVAFSLDGDSYEIDLSATHAAELRATVASYVEKANRVGGRKRTRRLA